MTLSRQASWTSSAAPVLLAGHCMMVLCCEKLAASAHGREVAALAEHPSAFESHAEQASDMVAVHGIPVTAA
jgi:hypothetical protein